MTAASEVQADGPDRVLGMPTRFGLGFALGFGPGPKSFRHPGSGGSLGLAEPDAGIGFGYAMNRMINAGPDDGRAARLVDALYRCLQRAKSSTIRPSRSSSTKPQQGSTRTAAYSSIATW